jgi:hypothetical protein
VNELLIPVDMLGGETQPKGPGPLGLFTRCYKTIESMKTNMEGKGYGDGPVVDFNAFQPVSVKRGLESQARDGKAQTCQLSQMDRYISRSCGSTF